MPSPTSGTLIDVVDERDHQVGVVPRGQVLARGENFRTVHVFVLGRGGCLLLQRLADSRDRHPGRWGSSVAAYLFSGEEYRDAAERRLREELGLRLPLEEIGKLEMTDERSLKFVSLFVAHGEKASNLEPDHIAALEFWPIAAVADAVETEPERFTPTFVELFRAFGGQLG